MFKIKIAIIIVVTAGIGFFVHHHRTAVKQAAQKATATATQDAAKIVAAELASHCAGNTLDQEVIVSISKQHMWACLGSTTVYDSAVITGMEMYPADLTPPGTYKIYGRQTDQRLTGHDSTGSWDDPVSYWMPFLSNQYGVYGFHDATWRADSDFGKIDINAPFTTTAKSASHGCVEMPLAAMKWLYGWAPVGTTVTVQS